MGSSSETMWSLPLAVHLVDQRGERGALAAARRAGDQHQPARKRRRATRRRVAARALRGCGMRLRDHAEGAADGCPACR